MASLADALRSRKRSLDEVCRLLLAVMPTIERSRGQHGPDVIEIQGDPEGLAAGEVLAARVRSGAEPRLGPYQAPEVGWGHAGAASAVYLICALLYEALSGAPPFPEAEPEALQVRKLLESVPTLPPGPHGALAKLVTRGLAPQVEDRPTLAELRVALGMPPAQAASPTMAATSVAPPPSAPAPRAPPAAATPQALAPRPATPGSAPITSPGSRAPMVAVGCAGVAALFGLSGLFLALGLLLLSAHAGLTIGPILAVVLALPSLGALGLALGLLAAGGYGLITRREAPPPTPAPFTPSPDLLRAAEESSILADPPDPDFRPFHIGSYWIFGRLGEGGMGVVYKARHMSLGRLAAVKVLAPRVSMQPVNLGWFKREARLTARIRHPNVVTIYDFGSIDDHLHYIAMEHVSGQPLSGRIHAGGMPLPRVGELVRQVAAGLDAAHAVGVIHRDLKPDNVIVDESRAGLRAMLVDFGIARQGGTGSAATSAMVVGTVQYMSPEQARGDADLDARTDVFALGVLSYELLTGELPFGGHDDRFVRALLERGRLDEPPPPARKRRPELAPAVDRALARAMSPDRAQRPSTAGAFAGELSRALGI